MRALKDIRKLSPDIVFTDLIIPGCSGVELVEKLRENGADCEYDIVSAHSDFEQSSTHEWP